MPKGDKSKYSDKQKRKAEHITEGYEKRGTSEKEAKSRAWATVNKESGGGNKSGSGRGKADTHVSSEKGGKKGGTPKKVAVQDDAFKGEESLSAALGAYTAFSVAERKQYILQVKQAALRDGSPALTPEQTAQVNADISVLQKP